MEIQAFKQLPILGIIRGIVSDDLKPLLVSIESSGLKTIEITMNTKGAPELIREARRLSKGRLTIGAGTVLDMKSLKAALEAGASFIVMPVLVKEVVDYCVKNRIPVFPGALTPQEIYAAWATGATMVKVFPSSFWGPDYFKEIRGPFDDLELLACGGVKPDNMASFFAHGANAVSFGASVFKHEWLKSKDFKKIEMAIKDFIDGYRSIERVFGS
ncbi:MAG: bifunctional 4-hydroxy-2-oxoglutarate aldolase/2-dehydro-3-deoxy-phosphogluconate aldolase [Candidatus Omnitrophica bacterium]|nr:bifunctional 4-hydroxy-2-oxoglutarate aldolase/2-dehydro-3-deoxy-phosphogluconate aldolase [Candidatus Omnitrophota bacterium]